MYTFFERDATNNYASIDLIGENGDKNSLSQRSVSRKFNR